MKNDDFFKLIEDSNVITVLQSDRPDGDSLASALFLEDVLGQMGKQVHLYCGVNVPDYIRFLPGWDRVTNELPNSSDISILVDNSALALIDKFNNLNSAAAFKRKPFIIADHHSHVECDIPYASLNISQPGFASAGELLYQIFKDHGTAISLNAQKMAMQSILSDTLGLTNQLATAQTYRRLADMIDAGVDRPELEEARRQYSKMDEAVFRYKAELMQRTVLALDGKLAYCVITEDEAFDVGTLYNPGPLILSELLMIKNIQVVIAFKTYRHKLTAAIRCTHGNPVANDLAEQFGGGGHPYSAGFKIEDWDGDFSKIKQEVIAKLAELLS